MKKYNRSLKRIFIFTFYNLCIICLLLFIPPWLKVEIRNALFTTAVPAHFFEMSQAELKNVNNNFIWFNPNIRDRYKEKIQQKKYIDSLIQLNLKDNDLVKQLVLHFSKNGSEAPGDCGKFSDDLVKNMEWLNTETGKGCCSDHSQVLIAYS